MVQFLRPMAYGATTAIMLCGAAFLAPADAAGQKTEQQQVQQKPVTNGGAQPQNNTQKQVDPATNGATDTKKAPVASPQTFTNVQRVDARAAELEQKLKVTPQQKPQWDKVVAVMRGNAETIEDVINHRRQNAGKMTALEDMRSYQTLSEKHAQGMDNLVDVFEPFYQTLTPEQKKIADEEFTSYRKRVSSRANGKQPPASVAN